MVDHLEIADVVLEQDNSAIFTVNEEGASVITFTNDSDKIREYGKRIIDAFHDLCG